MTEKEIQLGELWVEKLKDNEKHSISDLFQEFPKDDQKLAEEVLSWLIYYKYVILRNTPDYTGWTIQLQRDWSPQR